MANNDLLNNENILVKVDQNNLIYVDPNSVVDKDGNIQPRGVNPEQLVIYANLEADIVPRSILAAGNDQNTLISIAKGTLNFLTNQKGKDFDTSWTETFNYNSVPENTKEAEIYDASGQSFGIDSISVVIKGANSIPQVNISFIDVRGKTLFESAKNSPYSAFFHIPWPIFYLTLKGYYGKAIRYRLHMVKFSSKFNENNGNFEVQTVFVGSTFAYLNDISLMSMLNAPYMYLVETENKKNQSTNDDVTTISVSSSSRGYSTLKSIYSEYKRKGLVSKDFPVITLRELIVKAQSLDKILEKQILYETLHPDIFVGLEDFESKIVNFKRAVTAWASVNLTNAFTPVVINNVNVDEYNLKETPATNKRIIGNTEGTLEFLINNNIKSLNESKLFTDTLIDAANQGKTGGGNFRKEKLLSKSVDKIDKYYNKSNNRVRIDLLIEDIDNITKNFIEQRDKVEATIEEKMNEIIKKSEFGFGFEPTIRNIFAVILANADTYIRLMKEVHRKAFLISTDRAQKLSILRTSKETKDDLPIYPWPEVKKDVVNEKSRVIAYPAEKDLIKKLKSDDFNLWPEVEFVENYIEVSTNKLDTNTEKEKTVKKINYVFSNDNNQNAYNIVSSLEYVNGIIPYVDITPSSYLYEIYERANHFTMIDSFNSNILIELARLEFENISESLKNELELRVILNEGITSVASFDEFLKSYSFFERYPYYLDNIPTTKYLQDNLAISHELKEFDKDKRTVNNSNFTTINNNLKNYTPENYRKDIYPFNSSAYLQYLNINSLTIDELKYIDVLEVNPFEGFITTPISPKSWIKPGVINNNHLFSNYLINNRTKSSILNTPYFHNQLYSDFLKTASYGKYAGSAYLLLNSLPFLDLEDKITFSDSQKTYAPIRMSSLFRNVGSTHFIPYHLICKWGSLYHRYKKFILEGVDILDGSLNVNYKTKNIDGQTFFNNNDTGTTYTNFTIGTDVITYSSQKDVGVHPFYDAIFHQVVNDYTHYETISGDTSFSFNVSQKSILYKKDTQSNGINYWSSFVDNSKYNVSDLRYTLLPSVGGSINVNKSLNNQSQTTYINEPFSEAYENYFKIIWDDNLINDSFTNKKFPSPDDYFKTFSTNQNLNSLYSVDGDYRKLLDLMGTFSPNILEEFEEIFLRFATEKFTSTSTDSKYPNIKYTSFQTLLKEMVSINKETVDDTVSVGVLINRLKIKQNKKLLDLTNEILSNENTLKFTMANPKEINYHVWHGFADVDNINTFSVNGYDSLQLTNENKNYIKLYLGEDIDLHYQNFFAVNDVQLNQTNILQFRPLILLYAGYVKSGNSNNKASFQNYIRTNVFGLFGATQRRNIYLTELVNKFKKLDKTQTIVGNKNIVIGYETDKVKLENYNYFKSFNDKWVGGNSIGQRLLLEEFLFLDKANKDIGSKIFLNIDKIKQLGQQDYAKTNLYSIISILIQDTGIDMRPLPAYINFYGTNYNNKTKIRPSKSVAKDLFGTYLEVDYQDSSPKIILQLVGPSSKHLEIPSKKYKFADDSFYIASVNNNPLIILPEVFNNVDLSKSNRVVAFEVSFGDQNQSIFKGVQLDQSSLKNTSESFVVLENIARSESGAGAYNVDISLFEYYRQASYTCDVTCMGNVMIQPTMYFYLKNIPMFKGSYWITEVTHNIRGNNFTTTFKGARIPYASLPDPKDSFVSSYRVLFDRLKKDTIFKQQSAASGTINTTKTIKSTDGKSYTVNIGQEYVGEDFDKIVVQRAGVTEFGIPYNGYPINNNIQISEIQLVKYTYPNFKQNEWLRARVFEYGSENSKFKIDDNDVMSVISLIKTQTKLKWSEIKETRKTTDFYSTILLEPEKYVNKIRNARTVFVNPINKKMSIVSSLITGETGKRVVTGVIDTGVAENFGVGLSYSLMKKLNLKPGDIVYFINE